MNKSIKKKRNYKKIEINLLENDADTQNNECKDGEHEIKSFIDVVDKKYDGLLEKGNKQVLVPSTTCLRCNKSFDRKIKEIISICPICGRTCELRKTLDIWGPNNPNLEPKLYCSSTNCYHSFLDPKKKNHYIQYPHFEIIWE